MAAITGRKLLQVSKRCLVIHRSFLNDLGNNLYRHTMRTEEEAHIYKQSMNKRDVINYLVKNVAFENEDWIVTNKPYGVGLAKPYKAVKWYNARTFNEVYLKEILPLLVKEFNVNSLDIIFTPERFTSGVIVFGKTAESVEKFKDYHLANIKRASLQYGFIAVTLFEPVSKIGENKFKLKFDKRSRTVEIVNRQKSFTGSIIICKHELKDFSKFCSLVEVRSNKVIHNCVSDYLEKHCLSPVLGEVSFNTSVSKIGNVSFPVAADKPIKDFKNLDPELLSKLKLNEDEVSLIPKHLHLKSFVMRTRKNQEFFVSVPPPESFLWTCDQLSLSLNKIAVN